MSAHHRTTAWLTVSKAARKIITASLPLPCVNCGHPVEPGQPFHVGHIRDAALGGTDDLSNLGPSHSGGGRTCNQKAGGRLAQRLAQARRATPAQDRNKPSW